MKPKLCDCIGECFKHRKEIKCCYCNVECDWKEDKQLWYCDLCNVYWTTDYELVDNQPERSKREDYYIGGYFPPPWNPNEHPEKTKGWIAFQEEQRKDPKYYGCGALNSMET